MPMRDVDVLKANFNDHEIEHLRDYVLTTAEKEHHDFTEIVFVGSWLVTECPRPLDQPRTTAPSLRG
jgi:hypothetical protein